MDPNKSLLDAGGEEDHQPHRKPTNHPTAMLNGEKSAESDTPTVYIKSRHDDGPSSSNPLPEFNPDDLVGRTFLLASGDNGERLRAKVTEFRQPLQVQSHLEMPRILVQLGHTQRTQKLAPQTDPKWSPTWSLTRF